MIDMSSAEQPRDVSDVLGNLTFFATPSLATLESGERIAALIINSSWGFHTRDEHAGAEPVNLLLAAALGRGFALLMTRDITEWTSLPVLDGWRAVVDRGRQLVRVLEPDGVALYDGSLGPGVPAGWHETAAEGGLLTVLMSESLAGHGQRPGGTVGAQVRADFPTQVVQ
jgi:hypothetical protein